MASSTRAAALSSFCARKCIELVPGWSTLEPASLTVTPLHGGLTNKLFKVISSATTASPHTVVCRVYGSTHLFFERADEHRVLAALSAHGCGLDLVIPFDSSEFGGGRVESFLPGHTLRMVDLHSPVLSPMIAKWMAIIHSLEVAELSRDCALYKNLLSWSKLAMSIESFGMDLVAEATSLVKRLRSLNAPTVLCHNDLQEGNLIYDKARDHLHVIDFEYAAYNPRGFEMANHFCEMYLDNFHDKWPFFRLSVDKAPTDEQRRTFARAYLQSASPQSAEIAERDVQALADEAAAFMPASHLMWACWAILQSASSDIEFGYLDYARARLDEYKRLSSATET